MNQTNRVDYDLIVNELKKSLVSWCIGAAEKALYADQFFEYCRTITFSGTRQTGKSNYLASVIKRDPAAIMVAGNDVMQRAVAQNNDLSASECERLVSIREIVDLIKRDALPDYRMILVDDAHYQYHFFKKTLTQYLLKKKRYDTVIVLAG